MGIAELIIWELMSMETDKHFEYESHSFINTYLTNMLKILYWYAWKFCF